MCRPTRLTTAWDVLHRKLSPRIRGARDALPQL